MVRVRRASGRRQVFRSPAARPVSQDYFCTQRRFAGEQRRGVGTRTPERERNPPRRQKGDLRGWVKFLIPP